MNMNDNPADFLMKMLPMSEEVMGICSDAIASHIWVFYRGSYGCIVSEHLLIASNI